MSEKNIDTFGEKINENQTVDRRTYLKLAGAAGSGLGAGVGTGALGTEFTTPVRAASTTVDDFTYSSGGLSDRYVFDQDAGNATVVTASTVGSSDDDSNVLEVKDGTSVLHAYQGDGDTDLNAYPEIGDTFSCWIRESNGTGTMNFYYGAQDANNKYYVQLNLSNAHLGLFKYVNGSGNSLAGDWSNSTIANNTGWFKVEIQWTTGHKHTVTLYQNGSQVTSFSYTEGSSDPKFTANGTGFGGHLESGETAQFDYATTTQSKSNSFAYKIAEGFDNQNLDHYTFDRGDADIVQGSDYSGPNDLGGCFSGEQTLKISDANTEIHDSNIGGPSAGDSARTWFMITDGTENLNMGYGVQNDNNRYYAKVNADIDYLGLFKCVDGECSTINGNGASISLDTDTWYCLDVDWQTDGTHTAQVYDTEATEIASVSATESNIDFTQGGIGFDGYTASDGGTIYFDNYSVGDFEFDRDTTGRFGLQEEHSVDNNYIEDEGHRNVSSFSYHLNYTATGKVTEQLTSGQTVDYYAHFFNIGALFNTFQREDGFDDDNPDATYLEPIPEQRRNYLSIDVQDYDSSLVDDGYDYITEHSEYRYNADLTGQEWEGWISSNLEESASYEDIVNSLQNNSEISGDALDSPYVNLLFNVASIVSLRVDVLTLKFAAAVASGLGIIDALKKSDNFSKEEGAVSESLEWTYSPEVALSTFTTHYLVKIPAGESTTVEMNCQIDSGGGKYPANETGVITLQFAGDGSRPEISITSEDR